MTGVVGLAARIHDSLINQAHELLPGVYRHPPDPAVQHEAHGAVRSEHAAQRCETPLGLREMMEHAGAAHQIEGLEARGREIEY